MKEQVTETTIDKLVPDDKNFNRGTEYGKQLLGKSFGQFGAGRSILIDKNNRIIAGNKATEEYGEQGGEKVIVVETDGKTLVAVKRTDIDLDSKRGRELALADNATQKADLDWAGDVVKAVSEEWGIDAKEWGVNTEEWTPTIPDEERGDADYDNPKMIFQFNAKEYGFVCDALAMIDASKENALLQLLHYGEDSETA